MVLLVGLPPILSLLLLSIIISLYFVFLTENFRLCPGDFDVSIKTVNGKVYISWNTSSLWQNTTVYFSSNLHDNVTNKSFPVSIGVCNASISSEKSWKIEPIEGNLLQFCNKSRKCGPVNGKTSLVKASGTKATGTQELHCELFTTCANFDDVYSIKVVSIGGGKDYSFQSRNMTILSESKFIKSS